MTEHASQVAPAAGTELDVTIILPVYNEVEHLKHEQLKGRPTSGYSPALTVGDFIFIPGMTSMALPGEPQRNGVAAAALMAVDLAAMFVFARDHVLGFVG